MNLVTTLVVLAVSAAIFIFGSWRAAKPADPLRPRLIPWRPIIVFAGAAGLLMLVHLVNLMGFQTGTNPMGGQRFP